MDERQSAFDYINVIPKHIPTMVVGTAFRMLAHNGETNTLKGNVNWIKP